MRISKSEPSATSNRVTKAAPFRHRFSLEVSSSKTIPRLSRPRTRSGKRTEILRSDLCLEIIVEASGFVWTMGWVLSGGGAALEKAFYALEHLAGRSRRMYDSAKLAAVSHAMREPASELLHFPHSIGEL